MNKQLIEGLKSLAQETLKVVLVTSQRANFHTLKTANKRSTKV